MDEVVEAVRASVPLWAVFLKVLQLRILHFLVRVHCSQLPPYTHLLHPHTLTERGRIVGRGLMIDIERYVRGLKLSVGTV